MTNYNDGNWHIWHGGECPVHPKSMVEAIWHDANQETTGIRKGLALGGAWRGQIVKFRVVKEYREPREWWIAGRNELAFPSAREAKTAFPGCDPIHVREVTE